MPRMYQGRLTRSKQKEHQSNFHQKRPREPCQHSSGGQCRMEGQRSLQNRRNQQWLASKSDIADSRWSG